MEFSKKITENGVVESTEEERKLIQSELDSHSKDLHYLAFDRQLSGFSPLGAWLNENTEVLSKENEIIESIIEGKKVCSLYPKENLTVFPFQKVENGNFYNIDLTNIDKAFADILDLNDNHYGAKYMVVDFGHTPNNLMDNFDLIIDWFKKLLKESKILAGIYII